MKNISYTKMHGAGNDYVYVNCTTTVPDFDPVQLAIKISDRHFGVGGDGLVMILPSDVADFKMRIFNADGSEAQMCGNATRCIGKFVYERGLTDKKEVTLETLGGIKIIKLAVNADNRVESVTVDMGEPYFTDVVRPDAQADVVDVEVDGVKYQFSPVNMGNPHAVFFTDEVNDAKVLGHGPILERHELFPERSNIEFARVIDRSNIEMRVWERGSGETLACGTGSCATAVAAIRRGFTSREVTIHLIGGDLLIYWDPNTNHVMMTGPATIVNDGVYYY